MDLQVFPSLYKIHVYIHCKVMEFRWLLEKLSVVTNWVTIAILFGSGSSSITAPLS